MILDDIQAEILLMAADNDALAFKLKELAHRAHILKARQEDLARRIQNMNFPEHVAQGINQNRS